MAQGVQGIDKNGPLEPAPLAIQACPVRVLLLHHSDGHDLASLYVSLYRVLPHGQDPTAARSPRREMKEQHLVSAVVGEPFQLAIHGGKEKIRIHFSLFNANGRRFLRGYRHTDAKARN